MIVGVRASILLSTPEVRALGWPVTIRVVVRLSWAPTGQRPFAFGDIHGTDELLDKAKMGEAIRAKMEAIERVVLEGGGDPTRASWLELEIVDRTDQVATPVVVQEDLPEVESSTEDLILAEAELDKDLC